MPGSRLSADLLIIGCDVVTMTRTTPTIPDGAIAIRNGAICWIGAASDAVNLIDARDRLDARGQIASPGLVDAHFHTAQQLLRGKMATFARKGQLQNPVWKKYYIPFESALEPEDVYLSGLIAYANMISVGTTCFADAGGPHPDAMGRAAEEVGVRGFIARSTVDQGNGIPSRMLSTTAAAIEENVALVRRWRGRGRVRASMSLRQIIVCSPELIQGMSAAAKSEDAWIHTHLCEGTYEIDYALERFNARPAEYLDRLGALGPRLHCAHSVLLSANEMDLYVSRNPSACHCSLNNYAIGAPRLTEMMRRGIRVGLGTDGVTAGGTLDIFAVAHAARVGQQAIMGTPSYHRGVVSPEELLEVATMGGARALSLEREIGSLETGKRADIILVDKTGFDQAPVEDPLYTLAACVNGRDVRTVLVDGDIVMRDRILMRVDLGVIHALLAARLPGITERFESAMAAA